MKLDPGKVFEEFVGTYTRLPLAQKVAIPLLLIAFTGAIVFVSNMAGRPDYQVLFSGLEEGDAAGVVEHLRDKKILFRLRDGGKTVEVSPPRVVNELRLELAAAGLPSGGNVGFEIFNENSLGRTGFVEKVYLLRALQGELERTIRSIEAVKEVRVHITNPKRSSFVSRDVLPTASVLLRLKAGTKLSPSQVKGISNLVSSAVERLEAKNVTILDTKGNQLNKDQTDESIELSGADLTRLEYKQTIEKNYQNRIESMLAEVLGHGRAVARVTAELDFSKFEREEELYDPAGVVTRSERTLEESRAAQVEGGVPGIISNLGDEGVAEAQAGAAGGNGRTEVVRNFEVSRAVSRTVSEVGRVSRLSVAVLVDGLYQEEETGEVGPDGEPVVERIFQQLPDETMDKIRALVEQAVGFDRVRGDEVTVESIRFTEAENFEELMQESTATQMVYLASEWAVPLVFVLMFFFVIVRPMMRYLLRPTDAESDLGRLLPAGLEELEAELEAERDKLKALPDVPELPQVDIEELEELLSENSRIVRENPQQAALLIRYWLNEGRV